MMNRWMPLLIFLSVPAPALATGNCEDLGTRYVLKEVAEAAGLLAFDVEIDWCDDKDGEETSGVIKATLVTDLKTRGKTWYFTPAGKAEAAHAPAGARKPAAEWAAFQKEKAFRPVAEVALQAAPNAAGCSAEVVAFDRKGKPIPLGDASGKDAFSTSRIGLRIKAGALELPPVRLGAHVLGEGEPLVYALPMASLKALHVVFVTAKCDGGPPAGYFGADDGGECYGTWTRYVRDVTPKKLPGLEKCLPPPP